MFSRTNKKALGKNKYSEWKQVTCYLQVLPFVPAIFSLCMLLLLMLLKILGKNHLNIVLKAKRMGVK